MFEVDEIYPCVVRYEGRYRHRMSRVIVSGHPALDVLDRTEHYAVLKNKRPVVYFLVHFFYQDNKLFMRILEKNEWKQVRGALLLIEKMKMLQDAEMSVKEEISGKAEMSDPYASYLLEDEDD